MLTIAAAGLAVLMTWPLAPDLGSRGRVNTGDGLFSLWVVSWVARTLVADPANLYDANIFHPHQYTLAYSEANIVAGAMGVPFYWVSKNPFVTHNAVVLIAFGLSFLSAYALVAHLTRSRAAGWAAGVAFACGPYIFARTAHMQLLMTWGLPLSLLAFHRVVERPALARGAVLGLVLALQALACAYYGIFAALLVGLGTFYFAAAHGTWRTPRYWSAIAVGALVSIALTLPFFLPFLWVQQELGFTRTIEDARMYSAHWQAWVSSSAWAHRWWLTWLPASNEVLFPGIVTTVLGLFGLVVALRGRAIDTATPAPLADGTPPVRRTAGFYALVGGLALWASFGPAAGLYTVLFNYIPVFSFLRAPARFGILALLALAVGLGFAMTWLRRSLPRKALAISVVVPSVLVAELLTAPLPIPVAPPVSRAYPLLAKLRPGAVVELPFFYQRTDFPRHTLYMLNSTYHWRPLVNGYSDHIPQDFRDMVIPLSSFPTRESFRLLEPRRVRYAIFHLDLYDRRSREKLLERLEQYREFLSPLSREDDVWLFEITGWPR